MDASDDAAPSADRRATPRRVAVVGAGLTGLATAYGLERALPDAEVVVYEAGPRPGGKARTVQRDGYTVDWGPNGFLTNAPETLELVNELGLGSELQPASAAARRRYLYLDGALRPLPASPGAFLASEVVPPAGRLRAALEPFLAGRVDAEETVHGFLERHFGRPLADALGGALVSGITAGDPHELSLDALFPRLRAMERGHGSLVRALIAQQRTARPRRRSRVGDRPAAPTAHGAQDRPPDGTPGRLTSFHGGGMQVLVDTLYAALKGDVLLRTPVEALERPADGAPGVVVRAAGQQPQRFDAVVLTAEAPAAASLLRPLAPAAADALDGIPYAGVRVTGLGFDRVDVPHALHGFGFLVPRGQGVRSLGVLWTSTLYPGRAPAGKVLLRVLAGGRLDPELLSLADDDALDAVRRDLRLTLGIVAEPEFVETKAWPRAIPQYALGHAGRVDAAERALAALPGVHLAGNAYRGVGVNDCVREARRVVDRLSGV